MYDHRGIGGEYVEALELEFDALPVVVEHEIRHPNRVTDPRASRPIRQITRIGSHTFGGEQACRG